ncbi:SAV_915 family protein [Streptomyces sp. NPDC096132]|uniref:SAV_915 family protein n=1 Tax=Streptomyces sp. NPDC096132 TaxID=3366075 RepID=UPI00381B951D
MGGPSRSRLLDYFEAEPSADSAPESRSSRLLEYVVDAAAPAVPGPRPGVPAYHTPVFVPAHPRYVTATDVSEAATPTRVPFLTYELFEHPTDGTVALAFTTLHALVAALGETQPWVVTSLGPLAEGVRGQGVTVHLDPRIAAGHPNWSPADLLAYAQEVR